MGNENCFDISEKSGVNLQCPTEEWETTLGSSQRGVLENEGWRNRYSTILVNLREECSSWLSLAGQLVCHWIFRAGITLKEEVEVSAWGICDRIGSNGLCKVYELSCGLKRALITDFLAIPVWFVLILIFVFPSVVNVRTQLFLSSWESIRIRSATLSDVYERRKSVSSMKLMLWKKRRQWNCTNWLTVKNGLTHWVLTD